MFLRIIVIGDTHIPKRAKKLPIIIENECMQADLIIHVGDWQTMEVFTKLAQLGKVEGVYGNVDSPELVELLPEQKLFSINGFEIGIIHGHGKSQTTEKRAIAAFKNSNVDCILFGHSHIPVKKYIGDTLLFNPGSATDKRRQPLYSYGILKVTDKIIAEHIYFEDKS
ncbi:MAG: metallophosphoesterase family protein [Bacillota bacterium]